jgi:nicotinamidase-related amidase
MKGVFLMGTNKAILLIIDPQVDFCDPKGNLYVGGAEKDVSRATKMINDNINLIERINITLDSHQYVHIAHPVFWVNSKGEHPNIFTIINVEDVENGTWRTTNPAMQDLGIKLC